MKYYKPDFLVYDEVVVEIKACSNNLRNLRNLWFLFKFGCGCAALAHLTSLKKKEIKRKQKLIPG